MDKIKIDDFPTMIPDEAIKKIVSLVFENKKIKRVNVNEGSVRI